MTIRSLADPAIVASAHHELARSRTTSAVTAMVASEARYWQAELRPRSLTAKSGEIPRHVNDIVYRHN
jgi:hypothetical protein